ncbi:hypothetical protein ACFOD9_10295 [Novosphingobium bradum]|uniref:Uncharacterized protein n=1 Tax=Novosphingobium bradum TaxID=1737444 RepID=A0ABV7IWQ4_9SPHN
MAVVVGVLAVAGLVFVTVTGLAMLAFYLLGEPGADADRGPVAATGLQPLHVWRHLTAVLRDKPRRLTANPRD